MKRKLSRYHRVTVVNRSAWPDPFLRVVCQWVYDVTFEHATRAGYVREGFKAVFPDTVFASPHGSAWLSEIRCVIYRHYRRGANHRARQGRRGLRSTPGKYWPRDWRESRFKWGGSVNLRSRVEMLVFLIAHEMRHATAENVAIRKAGGARGRSAMENDCNKCGAAVVARWRVERRAIMRRVKRAMVVARDKALLTAAIKRDRKTPEYKLQRASANLARWEIEAKRVARFMAKYRRQVKYYTGRAAAKGGAK